MTIRHSKGEQTDGYVHAAVITNVEIYENKNGTTTTGYSDRWEAPLMPQEAKAPFVDRKLANFFNEVNRQSVSKVVDENGETLVVYRGDMRKGAISFSTRGMKNTAESRSVIEYARQFMSDTMAAATAELEEQTAETRTETAAEPAQEGPESPRDEPSETDEDLPGRALQTLARSLCEALRSRSSRTSRSPLQIS